MIRRANETDGERIAEIHCYGWRNAYRNIVSEKFLYTELSVYKRVKHYRETKQYEKDEMYVYEEDGIIKGFMVIGPCRNEDRRNSFELWGIYIEPLMQDRGIGKQLMGYCEEIARERGYSENVLWVLRENGKSRRFYEKQGYVPDGSEIYMERIDAVEIRYGKTLREKERE